MTIKDAKRRFVVEGAAKLFLERSIAEVTIKDIAKATGLGEATIYRYFSGKTELILACALHLEAEAEQVFIANQRMTDGFRRILRFYEAYLQIFTDQPALYRFLQDFDAYCITGNVNTDEYADSLDRFKAAFVEAYKDALSDGAVRAVDDIDAFYYSTTHALLGLCKKLASGDLVRQDIQTNKTAEVRTLIDIILGYLSRA